jgi:sulfatase modifying factor 1
VKLNGNTLPGEDEILAKYPWGNPYIRNAKGCMLANFKPGRGNYYDDGFAYTAPVYSYFG